MPVLVLPHGVCAVCQYLPALHGKITVTQMNEHQPSLVEVSSSILTALKGKTASVLTQS